MPGQRRHYKKGAPPGAPPLEKPTEHAIINTALDLGFDVTKFSQPRNTMQTEGIPDIYIRHRVKRFTAFVEIKRPDVRVVSSAQAAWILYERQCGGIAFVADSPERFVQQLEEHGFPVTMKGLLA